MSAEVTRLDNGLVVATDAMPGFETSSVGVWVRAGARYESPERNGLSHLIEHMAFKGTARRSARAIAEEIEAVGGHLNAYTSREQTAYFARVLKDDVPLALDLLSDILQYSVLDEEELVRERAVVVQEIGEVRDTPDDLVFDHLQEVAFPGQPLGRAVLGTPERVSTFARHELLAYMSEFYLAPRMVVAAAGAVNHSAFVDLARAAFDALAPDAGPERAPARYEGGESRESRELEQVHVVLGFASVGYGDPDFYAAQVLSTVLGGGMSSRLFQEIREKRGLAYSIFSFAQSYLDAGIFGVYAGTSDTQADEVLALTAAEIEAVCQGISSDEAARARAQHKAGMLMALESSSSRCEQLGRQILIYGRPVSPTEIIRKIDAVDSAAIAHTARRVFGSKPSLAAIGPLGKLGPYDGVAARFA